MKITVSDEAIKNEYETLMSGYMQQPADQTEDATAKTKKAKPAIPPMSDSSKEYIQRTLERRVLLDSILAV